MNESAAVPARWSWTVDVRRGLTFCLPWPPSVGMYWRAPNEGPLAGRLLLSRKGREYRVAAARSLALFRVPMLNRAGRLAVRLILHPPDRRARDVDNYPKAILDALKPGVVKGVIVPGVILDDRHVEVLLVERGPLHAGGLVDVFLGDLES